MSVGTQVSPNSVICMIVLHRSDSFHNQLQSATAKIFRVGDRVSHQLRGSVFMKQLVLHPAYCSIIHNVYL